MRICCFRLPKFLCPLFRLLFGKKVVKKYFRHPRTIISDIIYRKKKKRLKKPFFVGIFYFSTLTESSPFSASVISVLLGFSSPLSITRASSVSTLL